MKTPAFICLALLAAAATAFAVDPPPDGGYADGNTAEGEDALFSLAGASQNTAIGFHALYSDTFGSVNTAIGWAALQNNNGAINTAIGAFALCLNTTGSGNAATGQATLYTNTSGSNNSAYGADALLYNSTGNSNTACGVSALNFNSTGSNNTADGSAALHNNTTGRGNTALGFKAGLNLTTGNDNIDIGSPGAAGESGNIRIGTKGTHTNVHIAGISGVTVAAGVNVVVDTEGHLGTVVSSQRYKEAIQPMAQSSEALLALKPVKFRYKKELDPEAIPQFGLVAEQVAKVDPELVARDESGKPYTVRYEAVNAMLLNEFLKEHQKVSAQEKEIAALKGTVAQQAAEQKRAIDALGATVKAQGEQIQKVSAQMQTKQDAPRLVSAGE